MYALTARGSRYIDEYTIGAGIPSPVLMENAAKGVVNEIESRFPNKETRILVLCGSGNNGGDAVAIARWLLHNEYLNTKLYFYGDLINASTEFKRQVKILKSSYPYFEIAGLRNSRDRNVVGAEYDVIVDGLFGIGLNRIIDKDRIGLIDYINSKSGYKISVDIPSGLNATTGHLMPTAICADLTVTFGGYKTGMFFESGREYCGEIKAIDIGLVKSAYNNIEDKLIVCDEKYLDKNLSKRLIGRDESGHKGTFGTVGIIVSGNGMLGASILAAKAAYRAGCGLVKVFCPTKFTGFFNVSIPEAVVVPYKSDDVIGALDHFTPGVDVILIGPGLKEDSTGKLLVKQILAGDKPTVFDAGALNLISKNLKAFRKRKCECVITPHLAEMARLCNEDVKTVANNRVAYTRAFSKKFEVSMVVKSDYSIISLIGNRAGQKLCINTVGNSGLATAGSGDVLAGVIASLIAQGNTYNSSLLFGVMLHGRAATKFTKDDNSKRKMMAGDIIDNLF